MRRTDGSEPLNSIDEVVGAPRCTRIVAYTTDYTFQGDVHHAIGERLLDVLNQGSVVDQMDLPQGFLLLTEVEIFPLDGKKSVTVSECVLNKSSVYLFGKEFRASRTPPVIRYRSACYRKETGSEHSNAVDRSRTVLHYRMGKNDIIDT
jgi:hypothetical protein